MNNNWWRKQSEMEAIQRDFINLPLEGKYLLSGPPGSGKTNLLLLRAEVMVGSGEADILFITFTNALADFIRSGAASRSFIAADQIKTFHSWAYDYIWQNLRQSTNGFNRERVIELLAEANRRRNAGHMYSAIFIDEAQDLDKREIELLFELSDKICICGDVRQGIYEMNGMSISSHPELVIYKLERHYRMGHEIAKVADKLLPKAVGTESLYDTCNYNQEIQGRSSAKIWPLPSRDAQFSKMVELIEIQLDAFKGETIGVFCGKRDTLDELYQRFYDSELFGHIYIHGIENEANFNTSIPIHAMTIHSSKGTEFKCVHIFGAEDLDTDGLRRTVLSYTGITRAKTALNVYYTGRTTRKLMNAFTERKDFNLNNLMPED